MKTILVVDDDNMFRTNMRRHLEKLGFEVIDLESGKDVKKLVSSREIDAVILDIMMDERDGFETIRELNAFPRRPKIVAVSSNALYLEVARNLGVDHVCIKPISFDSLSDVLK